jgi:tRNA A-37 threonylcarbamoyl transferase component Bud32
VATCPSCKGDFEASFCPRDGHRLIESPAPVLGDRYQLLRKVGEGAMGEVFEAEHVLLHRKVAVKLLQRRIAADPEARARLQREARSTTGLAHPNVVDTIDFGFAEGQAFLVMEWLDGENLEVRMTRGPLDIATALDIAAQACAGLAAAHDRGVIHRDLKPANLFLTRDHRGELLLKVLDFGIAKLALHETKLTATGVLIGTPNYMAPEQAEGQPIDARTDIYAMGVILYEMLTGTVPFLGETPLAVLHQHTSRLPILPSARAPDRGISDALDMLVMRCLSKLPDDRFTTMHELAAAIALIRGTVTPAGPSARGTASAPVALYAPSAPTTVATRARTHDAADDSLLAAAGARRRWIVPVVLAGLALAATVVVIMVINARPGGGTANAPRDAGLVATASRDATGTAVAAVAADARASAAVVQGATFAINGHGFAGTLVARPAVPVAGEAEELTIEIATLEPGLRAAAAAGRLTATIEVRYYKDHSLVEESRHVLDSNGRFTVTPRFAHSAKHHAHIDLLVDGKEIDHAKVDLFPELH